MMIIIAMDDLTSLLGLETYAETTSTAEMCWNISIECGEL